MHLIADPDTTRMLKKTERFQSIKLVHGIFELEIEHLCRIYRVLAFLRDGLPRNSRTLRQSEDGSCPRRSSSFAGWRRRREARYNPLYRSSDFDSGFFVLIENQKKNVWLDPVSNSLLLLRLSPAHALVFAREQTEGRGQQVPGGGLKPLRKAALCPKR